jgi:hypothetical protein
MHKLLLTVALALGVAGFASTPAKAWWGGRVGYYGVTGYYTPYANPYNYAPISYYAGPGMSFVPTGAYYGSYYAMPYRSYYYSPGYAGYTATPYGASYYYNPGYAGYSSGYSLWP